MEKNNIFQKIQECRCELQKMNLKKSGKNKFAGFEYYELSDFLPSVNELLKKYKLYSHFELTNGVASLGIYDTETTNVEKDSVLYSVPAVDVTIKGANEIQALGGKITYLHRYLWLICMNICESDMFDATSGKEDKTNKKTKPTQTNQGKQDLINFCKDNNIDMNTIAKEYNLNANSTSEDFAKALETIINKNIDNLG